MRPFEPLFNKCKTDERITILCFSVPYDELRQHWTKHAYTCISVNVARNFMSSSDGSNVAHCAVVTSNWGALSRQLVNMVMFILTTKIK